jgi:hypothetical protein
LPEWSERDSQANIPNRLLIALPVWGVQLVDRDGLHLSCDGCAHLALVQCDPGVLFEDDGPPCFLCITGDLASSGLRFWRGETVV